MTDLTENPSWEPGIYQLELVDPVVGGPGGLSNRQPQQLANRTAWLKAQVEAALDSAGAKQPLDATLTALAALAIAADKMIYTTGPDAFATTTLSAFIRTLLDDADAAAARTTLGAAPLDSPVFTGDPTAPTPAQFDSDGSVATTNFVQRALGNRSGVSGINSATTLTNSYSGKEISLYGSTGFVLTMPLGSTMPVGGVIKLSSVMTSGNCAVVRQGGDVFGMGSNSLTGITIYPGNDVEFVWTGSAWRLSGESQLPYSPLFVSSKSANGYQKLPSGLIIQWGISASVAAGATVGFALPIAFPTGVLQGVGAYLNSLLTIAGSPFVSNFTISEFQVKNGGSGPAQYSYIVVGH